MKSIILTSFFVAFAFIAMPASIAKACSTCGCSGGAEHSHKADKKPCAKCVEAKAHYAQTGEKKPCAKCAEAKAHYAKTGEKKPCMKCAKAKAHYDNKPIKTRVYDGYSNKGSLTIQSGTSFKSKASAGYNE